MCSRHVARLRATSTTGLALSLLVVAAAPLGGQDSSRAGRAFLAPGTVVRLRGGDRPLLHGPATVVEQRGDTLLLRERDGGLASLTLDQMPGLEVAQGRRPRSEGAVRGARVGVIVFGVPTLLATSVALIQDHGRTPSGCEFFCIPNSAAIGIAGTFLTGVAGLTGAVIGAAAPGTRWKHVDLSSTRVGIAPAPGGGATLAFGVRF